MPCDILCGRAIPPDPQGREVFRRLHHPGRPDRVGRDAARADAGLRSAGLGYGAADQADRVTSATALTHNIIQRLNKTFVTPIDREDIHELATSLDDVMDAIDAAATVVRRYRMSSLRYGARELASLVWQSAMQVKVAVEALEQQEGRARARRRGQSARERGRRCARRSAAPAVRGREGRHHRDQVEGDVSTCSKKPPTAARTAPTCSKASSSSTDSAGWSSPSSSLVIVVALVFDYINGFHDAANSIATVVSTRVLTPGQGRDVGGVLQLRRGVRVRHRRRQDHRLRHDRHHDRDLVGDPRRADRRDRLGPDHLVLRPADQLVARADRRLCRRGGRQGRAWRR